MSRTIFSRTRQASTLTSTKSTALLVIVLALISRSGFCQAPLQPANPTFDKGTPFKEGFALVVQGGRSYYIDTTGKYAFDMIFPVERIGGADDRFNLVQVRDKATHRSKWGIIREGHWILQPVYDSIDTRFDVWILKKQGKRSWCDTAGNLLAPFRFTNMGYLDGRYFDVQQGGKWGIYDARKDSVIIPFLYEEFDYCGGCGMSSDYVFAKKNGQWGIIGFDNKVRVPFAYEHEHLNMRSDEWVTSLRRKGSSVLINMRTGKTFASPEYQLPDNPIWGDLVCVGKNKKFGLVTAEGKPVTAFEYDCITWFDDMPERRPYYSCVEKNGLYGLIDTTGRIIIPVKHQGLIWAYDDSTYYMNGDEKKILLDQHGNRLLPDYYKEISELNSEGQSPYLFSLSGNGKYGLYNRRSGLLTPLDYDNVSAYGLPGFILVERDKRKGLLDLQGLEVLPTQFDEIGQFHSEPNILEVSKDDHRGLYDRSGKVILPPVYDYIFRDYADTNFLSLRISTPDGSLSGLGTIDGSVLLPPQYSSIAALNAHHWLLQKDSSYFLFDSQSGKKDSLPFKDITDAGENGFLLVSDGKAIKLLDPETGHTVSDGYQTIYGFRNHAALAQKDNKWGMIDPQGHVLIPFVFAQIGDFKAGLAFADKGDGKYGFIDSLGKEIIPFEYDKPSGFDNTADYLLGGNILLFRQDPASGDLLKGLATREGKVIAPPVYELIWKDDSAQRFIVRKQGNFGMLDSNGKPLIPLVYKDIQPDDINRFTNTVSLSFPLLCFDGQHWKYVTATGKVLSLSIREVTQNQRE